jgi:dihydroneopterin aldolase
MVGTAGFKGLCVECILGVYEHERQKMQTVIVDVELDYDFAAAAASDSILNAVDYDRVAAAVTELAERRRFQLLETMAEETAGMLLERLTSIHAVRLEIRKPEALPAAACSFVRLERKRP